MEPHTIDVDRGSRAKRARMRIPIVDRLNIGPRLTLFFIFIILLMLGGNTFLLWQFHLVRLQEERLTGVGQELIAVLRFQSDLLSFHARLDELAQSEDIDRLKREAGPLRTVLVEDTDRTRNALARLSIEAHLDPTFLPTLEAIESALPSQLEAITALATLGDWGAVRLRLANEKKPLEAQTSALVKSIDQQVSEEQAEAVSQVTRLQNRILLVVPLTTVFTLLIAAYLGLAITCSITEPLEQLMEGSKALARGEFQHQVSVIGQDELAQLGQVYNDTAGRLRSLYETLQNSEAYLAEAQRLTHTAELGLAGSGKRRLASVRGMVSDLWLRSRRGHAGVGKTAPPRSSGGSSQMARGHRASHPRKVGIRLGIPNPSARRHCQVGSHRRPSCFGRIRRIGAIRG